MEKVIAETPEVAAYSRRTGSELGLFATAQNTGDILVRLKPRSQRSRSAEEIIADMRPEAAGGGAARRDRVRPAAAGHARRPRRQPRRRSRSRSSATIPEVLAELAEPVEEMLGKIDGVVDVVGMQRGNPEVTWNIDPVASARLGLTVEDVSNQLPAAWLGDVGTDLRLLDRRVPVRVRLPDAFRFDPTQAARHADSHRRRQARARLGRRPADRGRTASRSCCARTCAAWRASPAGSRAATSAAPWRTSGPSCRS